MASGLGLRRRLVAGAAFALAVSCFADTASAQAERSHRLNLQNAYPKSLVHLGPAMQEFKANVELLSGGTVRVEVHEPGALVPPLEMIDAISKGAIDMAFGGSNWWSNKEKAFDFFTSVPFGPTASEYLAWIFNGGGVQLNDELYAKYNVKALFCHILPPEGGGWYKKEIKSADDFKGLRLRWAALGADMLVKLGASPQLLAPADIQPALERGAIDGAEFSIPSLDLGFKMNQVAKHVYYPGWHQQHGFNQVMINMDVWKRFSDRQRKIVEMTCNDMITRSLAETEAAQPPALHEFKRLGVNVHRYDDATLKRLREVWLEVAQEWSAKDANFARVWKSLSDFRGQFKLWKDVGYLD